MSRREMMTLMGALVVLWVGAQAAHAGRPKDIHATLLPGGVADAGGKMGFVDAERGGLDAVNLATGKMLWHADGELTPLLAANGRMYAYVPDGAAGRLRLVALETAHGRRVFQSQALPLPDWTTTAEGAPGAAFHAEASLEAGALVFRWQASKRPVFGNPPARGVPQPLEASGTARVSLPGGQAAMNTDAPPPQSLPAHARGPVTLGPRIFTLVELPASGMVPHPRRMECRDVATGRLLWTHALRPRPMDMGHLVM